MGSCLPRKKEVGGRESLGVGKVLPQACIYQFLVDGLPEPGRPQPPDISQPLDGGMVVEKVRRLGLPLLPQLGFEMLAK